MDEERLVKCSGCGKYVDMYYSARTFVNGGWLFFCKECEQNSTLGKVANHDYQNESGAALLQQ